MEHLLGIKDLNKEELLSLLKEAQSFVEISTRDVKKVPALRGKTIVNLFLENSTRTRSSFEIAGKRLSADTINISAGGSSVQKGETLLDTARNLEWMHPDILVLRHPASGAGHFISRYLKGTAVVNAGDGANEHPTQALLDCLTLMQHFESKGRSIEGLKISIVGDVLHSRVARSNIWAHALLGNEITLVGPHTFVPDNFGDCFNSKKVRISHNLSEGIEGADVVMCLRVQNERLGKFFIPSTLEYSREFGIGEKLLSKYAPESVVLHPGPINRGVEVSSSVVDGPRSLIHNQVTNGVAVRMAVLFKLALRGHESNEVD